MTLKERMSLYGAALSNGHQSNLSTAWHDKLMRDSGRTMQEALVRIEQLELQNGLWKAANGA